MSVNLDEKININASSTYNSAQVEPYKTIIPLKVKSWWMFDFAANPVFCRQMRITPFFLGFFSTLNGKQKENSLFPNCNSLWQQIKAISNSQIGIIWQILRHLFTKWWNFEFLFKYSEAGYNWNPTPNISIKRVILEIERGSLPIHTTGNKK